MILLLKVRKIDFSDFVSATSDLSPNFIKLKKSIQKVYDSQSILINCMIMCGKLISYECNSENLDTAADLSKFCTDFNDTMVLSP